MSRETTLAILYDLALQTVGEVRLGPLLLRVLNRFIHHTTFPCGLVLLFPFGRRGREGLPELHPMNLAQAVGDPILTPYIGKTIEVPNHLVSGTAELISYDTPLAGLPIREAFYRTVLRLPIPELGVMLLLASEPPKLALPFTEVIEPIQANLSRAIALCRSNEAHMAALREANRRLEKDKADQQALIARIKEAQAQLLQSEKMASIGQLAAGIAHEINNPVGYLKSNLYSLTAYTSDLIRLIDAYDEKEEKGKILKQELDYDFLRNDINKLIVESCEGVERVQHIVKDLKDFCHVDKIEWQHADLHRGLESTINLAWNELKYKADIAREYSELPAVECIARQLNQVFMNILVNAAQAITDHGTITVRTRLQEPWAVIEIADTGTGIPPDKINRIFEPFFTTKPVGKGTGLGLSIAYSIVERHHGRIEVESEMGKGTTFRIRIPLVRADARLSLNNPVASEISRSSAASPSVASDRAQLGPSA